MKEIRLGRGHPYQRNCGCEDELSNRALANGKKNALELLAFFVNSRLISFRNCRMLKLKLKLWDRSVSQLLTMICAAMRSPSSSWWKICHHSTKESSKEGVRTSACHTLPSIPKYFPNLGGREMAFWVSQKILLMHQVRSFLVHGLLPTY